LGNCSLINSLCKAALVSTKPTDLPQRKANNIDKGWFKKLRETLVRVPSLERKKKEEKAPTPHPQFDRYAHIFGSFSLESDFQQGSMFGGQH